MNHGGARFFNGLDPKGSGDGWNIVGNGSMAFHLAKGLSHFTSD
jgi:hypothetical protein